MKYKKLVTSNGKEIHIYDDMIPLQLRLAIWEFINNSLFKLGWQDGHTETSNKYKYLHSSFSENDNDNAGLLPFVKTTEINKHIENLALTKSVVNLSTPSDTYFGHTHPEKLVMLYYANMEWEHYWHGETVFFNDDLKEIEHSLIYTPGRIILFDASIPHALRPQSSSAHQFRFTYAMTFN